MTNDHRHHEMMVRDIGVCDCGQVKQYFPFEEDPNIKPVLLREGHVPGLEYIRKGNSIDVYYEGKLWATMSLATPDLEMVTSRIVQSMAKCYLREGSLTAGRSLWKQVKEYCARSKDDNWIIDQFPGRDRKTVRRYIRNVRKTKSGGNKTVARVHAPEAV